MTQAQGQSGGGHRLPQKLTMALAAVAMFTPFVTAGTAAVAAPTDPVNVTVKGADVEAAARNRNGLTYKGFGALSGNATSSLLMDYKAQHPDKYWELIQLLFGGEHPIMNAVKVEMGNDRNNSTGPNVATMRTADEYPDVAREPGFQLAADAKKVNPNVNVSLLRWSSPAWVGDNEAGDKASQDNIYKWYKNTILAVYRQYGYMVDVVNPAVNERYKQYDEVAPWIKDFAERVQNDADGFIGTGEDDPNAGFKSDEERKAFNAIRIIMGDEAYLWSSQQWMYSDPQLMKDVDVVGYHYGTGDDTADTFKRLADEADKEVWNSEAQSTFSASADRPNNTMNSDSGEPSPGDGTDFGGIYSALEMANWISTGFNHSRRTLSIWQPAIGSFYEGFQYSSKEVVNARDPWSGWIYYDGGVAVLQHFTEFAKTGWETDPANPTANGIWRGIPQASGSDLTDGNPPGKGSDANSSRGGANSYTTLASPDKKDFSTVIVNDSKYAKTYNIKAEDLDLGADKTMELWETRSADKGSGESYAANYLKLREELQPNADGTYTVTVKPWSILTATTLNSGKVGDSLSKAKASPEYTSENGGRDVLDTDSTGAKQGVTNDDYLYADDFEYKGYGNVLTLDPKSGKLVDSGEGYLESRGGDTGATARYTTDTNGAFEIVKQSDGGHVMRQQIGPDQKGGAWVDSDPRTTIGDNRWMNYTASVKVRFETDAAGQYASIGVRQQGGNAGGTDMSSGELKVRPDGTWSFQRMNWVISQGNLNDVAGVNWKAGAGQWNTIAVKAAGNVYTVLVNGVEVTSYTDTSAQAAGRIQLGSSFNNVQFDDLAVTTVPGYTPYATALIDDMHQTSWDNVDTPVLKFNDKWNHFNAQGMFVYLRTISNSTGQGAAMEYEFTGTGLDLNGSNSGGKAKLNVYVDGQLIAANAPTQWSSDTAPTAFTLRGLKNGKHTVRIETATADQFNIDTVSVITANADSSKVDVTALKAGVDAAKDLSEADYKPEGWAAFAAVRADAEAAIADPSAYGLDAEGAVALAARLTAAQNALVNVHVSEDVKDLGTVTLAGPDAKLPGTLKIDGVDHAVKWDDPEAASKVAAADPKAFGTTTLTGLTADKIGDVYQRFTVNVMVVPTDLVYFVDSGSTGSAADSAYGNVKGLFPDLRNGQADQTWNGTDEGKDWGYSSDANIVAAGDAKDWGSSYVGANYNQPVTYHLTLPKGSYEIVTVQAPRAGQQTNVYSQVTAADGSTLSARQNVTSNGEATAITHTVKVKDESVVNVEFGTNGTSGYNARLAMVYVRAVPEALGLQGAISAKGALPTTVKIDGVDTPVTWGAAPTGLKAYDTVHLTGDANSTAVTADYEVIPDGLTYYIDSGTNGADSPQYLAVKNAVALKNDKVDQASESDDQWGYVAEGTNTYADGAAQLGDKYATGLWQATTKQIYRLPLDAGTYTLTAGFKEFWPSVTARTMNHTVNANGKELSKGSVPLTAADSPMDASLTFTLSEPATVEYVLTNEGAGAEKPVISWLAVAKKTDKTVLQSAVDAAGKLAEADYTAATWAPFAKALADAKTVLANDDATSADVNAAVLALLKAQNDLVTAPAPEPEPTPVNKTVLQSVVDAAGKLVEAGYTADSWKPFAKALADAKTVLSDANATQDAVNAAAKALADAQGALAEAPAPSPEPEPTPVDKTALTAVVADAKAVKTDGYTAETVKAFNDAIKAAEAVLADKNATQKDVSKALTGLVSAWTGLKAESATPEPTPQPEADRTALNAAIAAAGKLTESGYTADSWKPFAEALATAKSVAADAKADQAKVNAATAKLVETQGALVAVLKTDALSAVVKGAETLKQSGYTVETWSPFAKALKAAKDVLARTQQGGSAAPTQSEVDAAATALASAQNALKTVKPAPEPQPNPQPQPEQPAAVDKTALKAAVEQGAKLTESDYTADSWKAFAAALKTAQDVLANGDATQQDVADAAAGLVQAAGALVRANAEGNNPQQPDQPADQPSKDQRPSADDQSGEAPSKDQNNAAQPAAKDQNKNRNAGTQQQPTQLSRTGASVLGLAAAAAVMIAAGAVLTLARRSRKE
ncbi:family 16 glycoside hydrolase [Bifidobacterium avesanii]|uniref:galactosylceramidase n=1 Tax=Bifidobacterium avesanii TaxID=1798157 RepID=A0A7K3TII8_9BIFI|nr:family 16 glycoside hydrolase [Bifidobacterium avesanii]KAB8290124.1 glycoside hydrolase [Bifidobacterium avesanii]NEG78928.1 DUF1080 domain-containing protein [Bifidobacterium avesanii]